MGYQREKTSHNETGVPAPGTSKSIRHNTAELN